MHASQEVEENLKGKATFDINLRAMRKISRRYSSLEKLFGFSNLLPPMQVKNSVSIQ